MIVRAVRTRIFKEGEDLTAFIKTYVPKLPERSVLIVTSKIVALAEGRTAALKDKKKIIEAESEWTMRAKHGLLTYKDGLFLWNAGIDTSNADGKLILLPKDSYKSARNIYLRLKKHYKIKNFGVVITDSRIMPLRAGVVAIALGYAGLTGVRDYRGKKDLFGDIYQVTRTDVADSIATAGVLTMGEGDERQPLCVIENAPVEFRERLDKKELIIPFEDDMYRPLFRTISRRKKR